MDIAAAATATATQQHDPSRDVVAAPPGCEWVLLDPRAVTGGFGTGSAAPSPTAAASVASNGRTVRVSLHPPPPGISYVEVASGDPFTRNPTVAAADGDLLLVDMGFYYSVGDEHDESRIRTHHVDDLFVYKADPERPSLRRLPARPGRHTDGGLHAGIVRVRVRGGGGGEFLVADLQTRVENLEGGCWCYVTELLRYTSVADRWEVRQLDMPDDDGVALRPSTWVTDAAFSSGGVVYWADYHRGVLSCDVAAAAANPELRFVGFPGKGTPLDYYDEDFRYGKRMYPERHRRLSVDGGGVLRFVDVKDSRDSTGEWGSVVMTTWSLRTPWELGWEKEHTLVLDDDAVLPPVLVGEAEEEAEKRVWVTPTFPVVSVQEDGVVHAVVWVGWECWMATLDMRSGSFRSCEMLQKKAGPEESDGDATEILGNAPLFWCEVGKYVSP
ncbi:unnamed protein product [Urochloa decumbens]|uniref:DUF1618 domain-containing protein n=1 Tax=Urochloa decumbens TaxID=240449 RepID=A0ABC9G3Q2_9POAL